jgi:hypothetical protein
VFVPLDDRPSTFLFVRQIARIGGGWLAVPDRSLLGVYLRPGKPDPVAAWLERAQAGCGQAVVSSDMLCYGGLVASRNAATPGDVALARLAALGRLRRPGLRVDVFGIIPRLSLRTSDREAPYERTLAQWATKPGAPPPEGVPADIVEEYLGVRKRNLAVLMRLIDMTSEGRIDRLVIGQDDSAGTGLHAEDQRRIREAILARHLGARALLLSGADEIGMDMIAGWLARRSGFTPSVRVVYSDPAAADEIPPLESLPLHEAVRAHIDLAGGRLARKGESEDILLYLQTPMAHPYSLPPADTRAAAWELANAVRESVLADTPTALADVALINMADPYLAQALIARVPLYRLQAYAAWNTPSNKIGTVLAQAVAHRLYERFGAAWEEPRVLDSVTTHEAFLLARIVDDYRYQAIVRSQVRPDTVGLPPDPDPLLNLYGPVGLDVRLRLIAYTRRLFDRRFRGQRLYLPGLRRWAVLDRVCTECVLPWQRLFEVELRVDVHLEEAAAPPPPPPLRNLGPEPPATENPPEETH